MSNHNSDVENFHNNILKEPVSQDKKNIPHVHLPVSSSVSLEVEDVAVLT